MPRYSPLTAILAAVFFAATMPAFAQQVVPTSADKKKDCDCANKAALNLLPNGEFEIARKDSPIPEQWYASHPRNVRIIDLSDAFRRAVQVQVAPADLRQLAPGQGVELASDPIVVQMDRRYRCRGYIRSEGPRQDIIIRGYINAPRIVEGRPQPIEQQVFEVRKPWKVINDWRNFAFTVDLRPVMVNGRPTPIDHLRVILVAHEQPGLCWFDDVRFENAGEITDEKQ